MAILFLIGAIIFAILRRPSEDGGEGGIFGGIFGGGSPLPDGGGGDTGSAVGGGADSVDGGTLPISPEEKKKLVQISKGPVVGAAIREKANKILYFKLGTGHLYQSDFNGEGGEERISNLTIKDIFDAHWSYDTSYAFISALEADALKNYWLRLTGTSTIQSGAFQNSILSADFSPTDEKLATLTNLGDAYTLHISNGDGTKPKNIFTTKIPDFEIVWISKNTLALKTKSSAFAPSLLETLSTDGSHATVLSSERKGLDLVWTGDGKEYLMMEVKPSGRELQLALVESMDPEFKTPDTKILTFKTFPEKCTFSKKEESVLFCAIPRNIGSMPLPDAWWQGKISFEDVLWKINLESGQSDILLNGGGFDMKNIMLSPEENYIFFANKRDGSLWSFQLL